MKERPILFSSPMARAILDGGKTQTRRTVKPVGNDDGFVLMEQSDGSWWPYRSDDGESCFKTIRERDGKLYQNEIPFACPYGQPGDRLWVRETFCCDDYRYPDGPIDELKEALFYRADDEQPFEAPEGKFWNPSIHMPRWASRISLEITGVRVERLQDISEADAIAEGLSVWSNSERRGIQWECPPHVQRFGTGDNIEDVAYDGRPVKDPREAYRGIWASINGAGSWEANPWVWCVEFKRVGVE